MIIWCVCVCVFLCPLIHSLTHMVLHVGCSIPYLPNIHIECIKLALVAFEFRFAFALCVTCTQFYRISASTKKTTTANNVRKDLSGVFIFVPCHESTLPSTTTQSRFISFLHSSLCPSEFLHGCVPLHCILCGIYM